MDTRAEQADSRRIGANPPAVSSSDRLQLEVVLLAEAAEPPLLPQPAEGDAATRSVLVATREPELRGYIRECLRTREDLRLVEVLDQETLSEASRRLRPDLLIADAPDSAGGWASLPHPLPAFPGDPWGDPRGERRALLLIADELPEDWQLWQTRQKAPVAFLLTPFNARRLTGEVERLLSVDPSRPSPVRPGTENE